MTSLSPVVFVVLKNYLFSGFYCLLEEIKNVKGRVKASKLLLCVCVFTQQYMKTAESPVWLIVFKVHLHMRILLMRRELLYSFSMFLKLRTSPQKFMCVPQEQGVSARYLLAC